jgi:hypothetical protein
MKIRVYVGAFNSEGAPELLPFDVHCSSEEYVVGDHYDMARAMAQEQGYKPSFHFDERDPAARQLQPAVAPPGWEIDCEDDEILIKAPNGNGTYVKNRGTLVNRLLYNLGNDLLQAHKGQKESERPEELRPNPVQRDSP